MNADHAFRAGSGTASAEIQTDPGGVGREYSISKSSANQQAAFSYQPPA
jgi:hypothetical protein